MVLKRPLYAAELLAAFESDVISDGTQTAVRRHPADTPFESDVISDGTQTNCDGIVEYSRFESDVISDGTQTHQFHNNVEA